MASAPRTFQPPKLTDEAELHRKAHHFCLSHGLTFVPHPSDGRAAPIACTLRPTPFREQAFKEAYLLQPTIHDLFCKLAGDASFVEETLKPVGVSDAFVRNLLDIWDKARHLNSSRDKRYELALFRSDYLLDTRCLQPKQVEINTIAPAFGCLSQRTYELHQYLQPFRPAAGGVLPDWNDNIKDLGDAFARAVETYEREWGKKEQRLAVLFVVQEEERNLIDQHLLECELGERGIHVLRRSLTAIATEASLDVNTNALTIGDFEISLIYFRAGYTPSDYPTAAEWGARLTLERSRAVLSPSIIMHLLGSKKVQEALITQPQTLRKHLDENTSTLLERTFMRMMPLKDGLAEARVGTGWVLKPQREGGGNNVYDADIPGFVDGLTTEEMEGYTLMEKIRAPLVEGVIMKAVGEDAGLVHGPVISELGIYGAVLRNMASQGDDAIIDDSKIGWLLRTKTASTNEGGVNTGSSALDCPLLLDNESYQAFVI